MFGLPNTLHCLSGLSSEKRDKPRLRDYCTNPHTVYTLWQLAVVNLGCSGTELKCRIGIIEVNDTQNSKDELKRKEGLPICHTEKE